MAAVSGADVARSRRHVGVTRRRTTASHVGEHQTLQHHLVGILGIGRQEHGAVGGDRKLGSSSAVIRTSPQSIKSSIDGIAGLRNMMSPTAAVLTVIVSLPSMQPSHSMLTLVFINPAHGTRRLRLPVGNQVLPRTHWGRWSVAYGSFGISPTTIADVARGHRCTRS